jgi:PPOX class probable F420-dependent enzyme
VDLPPELLALLKQPSTCYIATTMPDGSPQVTPGLVRHGRRGHQKARNIARDPRVAVTVSDPAHPSRYHAVRGRVVDVTRDGGAAHIEALSERYLGRPYPWYGGRDQVRLVVTIAADRLHSMG